MKVITDIKQIEELLTRSVVDVLPSKDLFKKELLSGRQLRIYIGADATGSALHIGHATNYIILEKLRKLGHKVIVLIGDFTARIGDPTDKTAARVQLTREEVLKNTKTWIKQLEPILGFNDTENPVEIVYNNDWLSKMNFEDVINLASHFTVQRMLERDMFEKRLKEEKPIYLHEFFYPLMQGYDSVHLDVDVEICGNDQTFNALAGRTLMQKYKHKEKFVFITTLLVNPVTGEKMMSKSQGTGVFLDASTNDMFGKIMSQPDENIPQLFTDCTYVSLSEVQKIKDDMKKGMVNPRNIKARLASEIVKIYHGEVAARSAEEAFEKTFAKGGVPEDIQEIQLGAHESLAEALIKSGIVESKTEWRRLVLDGAVKNDDSKITDPNFTPTETVVLKVGKRRFVKIIK